MKKEIKIYVDGQEIRLEQGGAIVRGSKGYLQCRFSFSDGWQKMKKVAVFSEGYGFKKEYAVPITGDVCHIPDAVTDGRRIYSWNERKCSDHNKGMCTGSGGLT